jgi:hypothetical protein
MIQYPELSINDLQVELRYVADLKKKLQHAGYSFRRSKSDFIRRDGNGRFHIKRDRHGRLFLHYDLFSAFNGHHISGIPMKKHLQIEAQRINQFGNIHGTTHETGTNE